MRVNVEFLKNNRGKSKGLVGVPVGSQKGWVDCRDSFTPPYLLSSSDASVSSFSHSRAFKNPLPFPLRLLVYFYDVWLRSTKKSTYLSHLISSMHHHRLKDQTLCPWIFLNYIRGIFVFLLHQTEMIGQESRDVLSSAASPLKLVPDIGILYWTIYTYIHLCSFI
ncbi:unnamed protein product [Lactuca saligna]|uniref:Uncharacterized protein n=1 Tax=Lactuca saligna TaxID=75948 RepID=A0AA35UPP2_LACSI|nr:unnamed protein product [Lactuca saligna]